MAAPAPGMMNATLQRLLVETVTQTPYLGQDAYGKPVYGPVVSRAARIDSTVKTVTNAQGQERLSTTLVIVNGDQPIEARDKLILSDGTAPAVQAIKAIRDLYAPARIVHYEIYL
jgi:hypothetical protein